MNCLWRTTLYSGIFNLIDADKDEGLPDRDRLFISQVHQGNYCNTQKYLLTLIIIIIINDELLLLWSIFIVMMINYKEERGEKVVDR